MSHLLAYVLLPKEIEAVRKRVDELMRPFMYEFEVPEYEGPCHCVYQDAAQKAVQLGQDHFEFLESMRPPSDSSLAGDGLESLQPLGRLGGEKTDEPAPRMHAVFIKDPDGFYELRMTEIFGNALPAGDCEECQGTGVVRSTMNHSGRVEDWALDVGFVKNLLADSMKRTDVQWVQTYFVSISDVALDKIPVPHVIVTPDGTWHEKEEFAWGGMAVIINQNWETFAREMLDQYADHNLVVVNCY